MNPKLVQQVIDAIEKGDGQAALDLLKQALTEAAGGEAADQAEDAADANGGAPDPMAPGAQSKAPPLGSAEYSAMSKRLAELEATEASRELAERQGLIAELVALKAETPASAWHTAEAVGDKPAVTAADRVPCPRLAGIKIADMRSHVVALRKAAPNAPRPPPREAPADNANTSVEAEAKKLRPEVVAAAKERGLSPEQYVIARRGAVSFQPSAHAAGNK